MTIYGQETVDFDIHLSVSEIYDEMSAEEEQEMRNLLGTNFKVRTLADEMKIELLEELFKTKSLNELQDIVNNNK